MGRKVAKKPKKIKPADIKYDFHRLAQEKINYIDTMVRALGSYKEVDKFYSRDSLVGEFARTLARAYYGDRNDT